MSPSRSVRFGRWVRSAFTERLAYKAAALFFAIVLWGIVSGDETTEAVVPVQFDPDADSTLGAVRDAPRFRALVAGRGRDIIKLYAAPPVFRPTLGPGTYDTVTLRVTPRDLQLPDDIGVVVRDVQPRSAVIRFENTSRP